MTDAPTFFVARDRARRIAWHLEQILQERRLAWRGAEVGMASVADDADQRLAALAEEARTSVADVVEGRIRDRERGYLEMPFAVALEAVGTRLEAAAAAEADVRLGRVPATVARPRTEADLQAALDRLGAFLAAYDAKTPVLEARTADLGHLLARVDPELDPLVDRAPPPFHSEPHALEDLLLAVRTALAESESPWRVRMPGPGTPLTLTRGGEGAPSEQAPPEPVRRAADVLAFRHPVRVTVLAAPEDAGRDRIRGLEIALGEPTGASLETTLEMLAGPDAVLAPEAEAMVGQLLQSPPHGASTGPVAPERLIALQGLVHQLQTIVADVLVPALASSVARLAAGGIPREKTRKAPVRSAVARALAMAWPGLDPSRLGDVAKAVAKGRLRERDVTLGTAALLLAVFGRTSSPGGFRLERAIDLAPLSEGDVSALVSDLLDVDTGRGALQADPTNMAPTTLTRMECGLIAALGKLGRLP